MRSETERTYQERVLRVLVHIQEHLDEALPLEDLARVACFSPHHFHYLFGAMVGESVKEHVRRLRLERAAHRLLFSNQPVTTIAFDAGYETHESFTRAFRAMFGTSPSRFRTLRRQRWRRPAPCGIHYLSEGRPEGFNPMQRGGPPMDVRIETQTPMKVPFLRHLGPSPGRRLPIMLTGGARRPHPHCPAHVATTVPRLRHWPAPRRQPRPGLRAGRPRWGNGLLVRLR